MPGGAEGENRRVQPLLADRVGLKPRITEGYERATGLVAALSRARHEKNFRKWPPHIGRDARSQARDPLSPQLEGAALAPRSLKASRETSPLHRFRPVPGYGACRFCRACALKRMADAVSGLLRREDRRPPCACSVSRGKPSVSWSGPAVSTLIRKVSGLRRHRSGRFGREAAMTNAGLLAGRRRCIFPHVFAAVMALMQAVFHVAAHGAVDAEAQGLRERRGAQACPRS
jgi:hypothetical protein